MLYVLSVCCYPPSQALRDVARDAEVAAEATDVALNTRVAQLEEAKADLVEKDSMVSLVCRLKDELEELPRSIEWLRERLRESEDTLEELHRLHEDFVKDILNREHTLSLERRCVAVRSDKQTQEKLQGL